MKKLALIWCLVFILVLPLYSFAADSTINGLTAIDSVVSNDLFAVWDTSASTTKKVSPQALFEGLSASGLKDTLATAGTPTQGVVFRDNGTGSLLSFIHTYADPDAALNAEGITAGVTSTNTFVGYKAGNFTMNNSDAGNPDYAAHFPGTNNTGVGLLVLNSLTQGWDNAAVGMEALGHVTTGKMNTGMGAGAGYGITTGSYNTVVGTDSIDSGPCTGSSNTVVGEGACYAPTSANNNTLIGQGVGYSITSGSNNTMVGQSAGPNLATGSGNIYLGYKAGFKATGSSELYIDDLERASNAVEKTNSILFGTMAATVAGQDLKVNANLEVARTLSQQALVANGDSGASKTIDWRAGNNQSIVTTGSCSLTFTNPAGPCHLTLKIIHEASSTAYTYTWPSVAWPGGVAPVTSNTSGAVDIVSLFFDGSAYYGQAGLAFATP